MEQFNIGAVAGVILSLAFKYIPGLNAWYEKQTSQFKELFMLGMLVIVVAGMFGLSCLGWENYFACDQIGLKDALYVLVGAVIGNQGAYSMLSHQRE